MGLFEEKRECFDTSLSDELIWDETGDDVIYGQGSRNAFYGGDGDDRYIGGTDRDYLHAAVGADSTDSRDTRLYIRFKDEMIRSDYLNSQDIGLFGASDFVLV